MPLSLAIFMLWFMVDFVIFLYSRQRYMLGDGAMIKMAQSKVLLSGLGGLGIEIGRT